MIVYTSKNESIVLSDDAMSSGGEGEIHSVVYKPARFGNNICVKIYFKPKRTTQLENKLNYMVANPPNQIYSANNMIGWPLDVVYDNQKNFIGFVMPLAYSGSEPLIVMTAKKLSKKLNPVWFDKYDRSLGAVSMIARLKLICNIAIPIHILHSTRKYVLKDFKPENVLVTYDGKVTLVDMDSVQITENGRMLFPGTAATPNYIPPEYYTRGIGKNIRIPIENSWDYFAIGVVFYQVIFGLHPYVVMPAVIKDDCNEIFQNIAQNLFPFGANAARISNYPPPHKNFTRLPVELQTLFKNAFSDDTNARPKLEMWVKVIKSVIKQAPVIPQQKFGTISVQCTPNEASVKFDNSYYIGMTPVSFKAKVGYHRIDVSANGISQAFDSVEVKECETTYINVHLVDSQSVNNTNNGNNESTSAKSGCIWIFVIICILFALFIIIAI